MAVMKPEEWELECLTLLETMQSGQEWSKPLAQMYLMAFQTLGETCSRLAVQWACLNEKWRPSPAELRQFAARIASPYPDAEAAYSEILHKAQAVGLYGRPDPKRPTVFVEGAPPMSHPIVSQIVGYCGGWEQICSGEANKAEGLRKQVRSAHESVSREWEAKVIENLALPESKRDPRYFPVWRRHELPSWFVPEVDMGLSLPPAPREPENLVPMPPDVAEKLAALGLKQIGKPMPEGDV